MRFPAYCTYKPTGKLIVCPDGQTFNQDTMVYFAVIGGEQIEQQTQVDAITPKEKEPQTMSSRFNELKAARVWLHGTEEEQEEYATLKANLGK